MTRMREAGKGSRSEGCRGAEHGQTCTTDRTGAVAVRAALESAVQPGRRDEANRQSEMSNLTKCRYSILTIKSSYAAPGSRKPHPIRNQIPIQPVQTTRHQGRDCFGGVVQLHRLSRRWRLDDDKGNYTL
jgi:hypothetical protein